MAAPKKPRLGKPYALDMDPTEWLELSTTDRPQIEKRVREQVKSHEDAYTCSRCGRPRRDDEFWLFVFSTTRSEFFVHHPHCATRASKKLLAAAERKLREKAATV